MNHLLFEFKRWGFYFVYPYFYFYLLSFWLGFAWDIYKFLLNPPLFTNPIYQRLSYTREKNVSFLCIYSDLCSRKRISSKIRLMNLLFFLSRLRRSLWNVNFECKNIKYLSNHLLTRAATSKQQYSRRFSRQFCCLQHHEFTRAEPIGGRNSGWWGNFWF